MSDSADSPDGSVVEPVVKKPVVVKNRPVIRRPDVDTLFSINEDGSRNVIHPADVRGRFQRIKHILWLVLIGVYLAMPWVKIGGRPAFLIDLPARHFYLFGQTFNAQDFWLAFFWVTGIGFTLFVCAALFGRMWCGYACPQTVFLEGVFRRIERWIEGNAPTRAKLDKAPIKAKFWRRGLKMVVFFLISALIAHSFLGYFMPVELLVEAVTKSPGEHPTAFVFVLVVTLAMFVNFTWFREQLCIVVCPYGRLQGALYDQDTILVGYDQKRGEPRGPAGKEDASSQESTGDCVDCYRCVSVCPTGIDIRNGTQHECVGCANCIDACDEVMVKLGRDKGLVRYDSQSGFDTGKRRFLRGRVVLYAFLMLLGLAVFSFAVTRRRPFEAGLQRSGGRPYVVENDRVHNVFNLQLVNKQPTPRTFEVIPIGPEGAETIIATKKLSLDSFATQRIPVHVYLDRSAFKPGLRCEIKVVCRDESDPGAEPLELVSTAALLGPSAR